MRFNQKTYSEAELKDIVVKHILSEYRSAGLINSDSEYDSMYIRLKSEIDSKAIISKEVNVSGKMKAEDYNDIFYNLYIDMLTVFQKMNIAGDKLEEHKKLHQSIIANNNTKLDMLSDDLERLEERLFNASNDFIYTERFRTTDSFETDSRLYTDEVFHPMSPYSFVSYNKYGEFISLTRSSEINKITASNGQKMAELRINKQLGSDLIAIKNPLNVLSKAIDTSTASYWEESIFTEEPFNIELGKEYWYNSFGALCEIEIILSGMVNINEITLMPYGAYPLEVVAIKSYTSDYPDEEIPTIVVEPDSDSKILRSTISKEYITYQFETIMSKRLRIILNQRHYVRSSYILDKSEAERTQLWFGNNDEFNFKLNVKQVGMYQDKSILDKFWLMLSQKIYKLDITKIKDMLFPKNVDRVPITRFEYNYGLYNITASEVDYAFKSIYVSKPIKLNKNIASISLTVDEIVPSDIVTCSIDYYITTELYPNSAEDWIQIKPDVDEIDFNAMLVKGDIEPFIAKEAFISNKTKSLTLSHIPFVIFNNGVADAYIKLTITDKRGRALLSQNVTNYFNPLNSNYSFDNQSIYQYYIHKDKVYFNQKIPNGYKVEVIYRHFIDTIRVKAIFSKAWTEDTGITPVLNEFKLHYKVLE